MAAALLHKLYTIVVVLILKHPVYSYEFPAYVGGFGRIASNISERSCVTGDSHLFLAELHCACSSASPGREFAHFARFVLMLLCLPSIAITGHPNTTDITEHRHLGYVQTVFALRSFLSRNFADTNFYNEACALHTAHFPNAYSLMRNLPNKSNTS